MKLQQIMIPENTNVTLIGNPKNNKGTIFDFTNDGSEFCNFPIIFNVYTGQQFKVENITFLNFITSNQMKIESLFYTPNFDINYQMVFKNCSFINSDSPFLYLDVQGSINKNSDKYQILIDSCHFEKIRGNGIISLTNEVYKSKNINNYGIKIENSEFRDCDDIATLNFGKIEFNNCKFFNISSTLKEAAFVNIQFDSNLEVKNSEFYNDNTIQMAAPFIIDNGNEIKFDNVTMKNIQSEVGYLVKDIGQNIKNNTIVIDNSYFENISSLIYGENIDSYISNSTIYNIINKSSYPPIATSKYRNTYINNCKLKDIKLYETTLFDDQSFLFLNNTVIENISTFYKPIFQVYYNGIEFNNVHISNINIYCDVNECNLMTIEMGENKNKDIIFNNVSISTIKSNGNVFQFNGNDINVKFNNIEIRDSNSYGALLKCVSENAKIEFISSKINNNKNINKFDYGLIIIKNNINVSLINSEFNSNESFTSGTLYFDEIKNYNITIYNSTFSNNHCHNNGGVINLIDKFDILDEYIKSVNIDQSTFDGNKANYFGGVLYVNVFNSYKISVTNTNIVNNYAGVAGGFVFSEQINDQIHDISLSLNNTHFNNTISDNIAKSHGNNFATHPFMFKLYEKSDKDNSDIKKYSSDTIPGGSITFTLELQDGLGNKVIDSEKYYSDIGVQVELFDTQNNTVHNYDISKIDNTFNNGLNIINLSKVYVENLGEYYIHIQSKNNLFGILKTAFFDYKIIIKECDKSYYSIRRSNNLLYCESPKCDKKCLLNNNFECVKDDNDNNNINDPEYNICRCIKGKIGNDCQEDEFFDFSKRKKINNILVLITQVFLLIMVISLIPFRNYQVIKDFGKRSLISVAIGCCLGIYSNLFISSDRKCNCYIHLIMTFTGFTLIYLPFSTKLIISSNITIKFNQTHSDNILINTIFSSEVYEKMFKNEKTDLCSKLDMSNINEYLNKVFIQNTKFDEFHLECKSSQDSSNGGNSQHQSMKLGQRRSLLTSMMSIGRKSTIEKILLNIKLKIAIVRILFVISLIFCLTYTIIVENNVFEDITIDYIHVYRCPYIVYQIIIVFIELIFLVYIINLFLHVKNGRYIYIDVRIIGILSFTWIVFGPIINIMTYNLFDNDLVTAQQKKGNTRTFYFLSVPKQKCTTHNSYNCECETNKKFKHTKEEIQSINEYIKFYNSIF